MATGPADDMESGNLYFCAAIAAARKRVWIATPYFVPDLAVMAALRGAALRGVDVRIIIVEKADSLAVDLASYWYVDALEDVDIRFFRYREGFMHQKVVLVDDDFGVVGTVNWDSRSFRLNFEVNVIVAEESFVDEMVLMFKRDFARARAVLPGELKEKGFVFRFAVQLARLLSPVL